MNNKEFYAKVAELLDTTTDGEPFKYYKRTRWNNRIPGQGRFPGRGIVRIFGDQIHVALNNPPTHQIFQCQTECLIFLESLRKS